MNRIILIALFFFGCSSPAPHSGRSFEFQTNEYTSDALKYTSLIQYPICSDTLATCLNDSVKHFVEYRKATFLEGLVAISRDSLVQHSLRITTSRIYDSERFISYQFYSEVWSLGWTHSREQFVSFVYDLPTKSILKPTMLFLSPETTIKAEILKAMRRQGHVEPETPESLASLPLDEIHVSLDDADVVFAFDDYSITSYSGRPGEVRVPRASLKLVGEN